MVLDRGDARSSVPPVCLQSSPGLGRASDHREDASLLPRGFLGGDPGKPVGAPGPGRFSLLLLRLAALRGGGGELRSKVRRANHGHPGPKADEHKLWLAH